MDQRAIADRHVMGSRGYEGAIPNISAGSSTPMLKAVNSKLLALPGTG